MRKNALFHSRFIALLKNALLHLILAYGLSLNNMTMS